VSLCEHFLAWVSSRPEEINLNHGCSQGCSCARYDFFKFFAFLSVAVISLKGIHVTWWFKCNSMVKINRIGSGPSGVDFKGVIEHFGIP
jgi:hypothetical protein